MKAKPYCFASLLLTGFLILVVSSARAQSCDETIANGKAAAQKYFDSYEIFRTRTVDSIKHLVKAVCNADDANKQQVFLDETKRVQSVQIEGKDYMTECSDLNDLHSHAMMWLEHDPDWQCQAPEFPELLKRVKEIYDNVQQIEWKNQPMVDNVYAKDTAFHKLTELSHEVHNDYYEYNKKCAPYRDYEVGGLKPDCVDPDECMVIELEPDNRSAEDAWTNAKKLRDLLNTDTGFASFADNYDDFKEHFSQCKGKFKARVDCYQYCPEVDDVGTLKSTKPDWATCKSE